MTARASYAPLQRYLQRLPPDQDEVVLTFAEIEALVGIPLRQSARINTIQWHRPGRVLRWQRVGFNARLERWEQQVRFTRFAPSEPVITPRAGPPSYAGLLDYLAALPPEQDAVEVPFAELSVLL